MRSQPSRSWCTAFASLFWVVVGCVHLPLHAESGKLLLTGGVSTVEGAAGGGISPWAVIGTQATSGEVGISAYASAASTHDYKLRAYGAAVGVHDRVEMSVGRQDLDTGITGTALGVPGCI